MVRIAADRLPLRRTPGLRFAKLLGTGDGGMMLTARSADLRRWALVASWASSEAAAAFDAAPVSRRWRALADEEWRVTLTPLSSRGRWSGLAPFGAPEPSRWGGPVAVLTRARLAPSRAVTFWRAVPPVAAELNRADGLLTAFGIGEAPLGWQGTFSVWRDPATLNAFAYDGAAHAAAIRRTADVGWYAEELFARFGVVASRGTLDGKDPLA
jgi:hypothetical protein